MRVLVMGGTEFISLHLLRALQARGHEVSVFNRGLQPQRLPAGVTVIPGDRIHVGGPVLGPGHGGWLRQFGSVEVLAFVMAALLGDARAYGQAYNVMGEDVVSQVGFVELVAEAMGRPVTFRHFDPALLKGFAKPGPVFGQNLVYDCHAVHTTTKLRADLGLRPRYTLHAGLVQTSQWYRAQA